MTEGEDSHGVRSNLHKKKHRHSPATLFSVLQNTVGV